jgi:lipooligosaccharide transport system ATP-binding protein
MKSTVIEVKGLVKHYGDRVVVNGLNLEVEQGECFGILGPNGAGKSTTMKMLYGSSRIDGGEAFLLGLNARSSMREIKSRIGVIPQEDGLDTEFTVKQNLLLYAGYHGVDAQLAEHRTDDLLKLLRLEEYGEKAVATLSGGLRRRVAIARGMINQPELLFLDEPTAGLDPQARIWIWSFLRKIKADMGTVVMTTHYMEEAEHICDRIAIMDQGKVLVVGEPKQLIKEQIGREVIEFEVALEDLNYYLGRLNSSGYRYQVIRTQVNVHLRETDHVQSVMALLSGVNLTLRQPSLNDVFLKLAGHDLRDEPL